MYRSCFQALALLIAVPAWGLEVKPEINGTLEDDCRDNFTCSVEGSGVPSGNNAGLVYISGNYVTLKNISIEDSAGVFLDIDGDYCIIDGVDMAYAYFQAIRLVQGDGADCYLMNGSSASWNWAKNWPNGSNGQGGIIIRNHKDADGWGGFVQFWTFYDYGDERYGSEPRGKMSTETINFLEATHGIFADNISYGSANFYTDNAQKAVWERNACVFPEDPSGTPSCYTSTIEAYPPSTGAISFENDQALYRINAAINADNAMVIRDNDDTVPSNIDQQEIGFYANTALNLWRFGLDWTVTDNDADGPISFLSNIVWAPNAVGVGSNWPYDNSCRMIHSQSLMTDQYNAWDTGSLQAPCGDATDVYESDLGLATDEADWRTIGPANPFDWADLKPTASSAILGDGDDSLYTATISWLTDANFPQRADMQVVGVCNNTEANWQRVVPCSPDGTARPTSNTEPGAMQYP